MKIITAKISLDALMTIALLFVMGYQFWGDVAHEWIGALMVLMFIIHNALNFRWYKNLFRGKYTPIRILRLCVNALTFTSMAALGYSGIVMSRHVFAFLSIESGLALARQLHILGSHWGFVFMSLHLGLHWGMILKMATKKPASKNRSFVLTTVGALLAAYGLFVFIKRDFVTYMLLKSEFVFLDFNEPILLFFADYIALMGFWVFVAYYISKLCQRPAK